MRPTFFAFDTETTGLVPEEREILSIGILLLDAQLEELDRLVIHAHPDGECDPEAARINHYSPEEWTKRGAVSQKEMFDKLHGYLRNYSRLLPVGHNVKFDLAHLEQLFKRNNSQLLKSALSYHSLDTVTACLMLHLLKDGKHDSPLKLEILCKRYGIPLDKAHDAAADITATVELLKTVLRELRNADSPLPLPVLAPKKPMIEQVDGEWIFKVGKHVGTKVVDSPSEYLLWMVNSVSDLSTDQREYVQSTLQSRKRL